MTQFTSNRGQNSPVTESEILLDTREAVFSDERNTLGGETVVTGHLVVKVSPVGNIGGFSLYIDDECVLTGYKDEAAFDQQTTKVLVERGLKKAPAKSKK